ncbi:hypothetical protein RDWZM_000556 [Blomia tropicalis]|uniref:Acylphosphatase n=1 Tax=Blomia tropicalis TaxID=40697 RepID=A0A9Q0RQK3_BLOTA|nr:hypothetical protein RDWZM_000556 [Blomia tropicalis]
MSVVKPILSTEFKVSGRVQGVFFRKYTKGEADRLGLVGWVRNEQDGSVYGKIQGSADAVNQMKSWLQNKGSPMSKITSTNFLNEQTLDKFEYQDFRIVR